MQDQPLSLFQLVPLHALEILDYDRKGLKQWALEWNLENRLQNVRVILVNRLQFKTFVLGERIVQIQISVKVWRTIFGLDGLSFTT